MQQYTLRPAGPDDYPRLVEIMNMTNATPVTLEEFRRRCELRASDPRYLRLVAENGEQRIAGQGVLFHVPWRPVGTLTLNLAVDPDYRGHGVGRMLYDALEAKARDFGALTLESEVRDDRASAREFLERRGFALKDHYFRSELDLERFNAAPYRGVVAGLRAQGYQFITLADVDLEEGKRRLYEVDMDTARDEPGMNEGTEWPPISYEEYARDMYQAPKFDPAGVFLAVWQGQWVAVSGLHFPPGSEIAWVFYTGVRREHRGRRLAQALKLLTADYARSRGFKKIATGNHENNPAMLTVNRKFGFQPLPGLFIMRKLL